MKTRTIKMNDLGEDSDLLDHDIDINALGQVIDTTFGRSSSKIPTFSVKMSLGPGPSLIASYRIIVNFINTREQRDIKRKCETESTDIIGAVIKQVKADYKELAGSSITFKQVQASDDIEMLALNVYNPKKTAYYTRRIIYSIE